MAEVTYLVFWGTKTKRKIRHIGRQDDEGEWHTKCNIHYPSSHDSHARMLRTPRGSENEYPVCKRCINTYTRNANGRHADSCPDQHPA